MKRALQLILYLFGGVCVLIAVAHALIGTASIPGGTAVNATLDGEDRFYAVIFAGYGLAVIHAARDVVGRSSLLRGLLALFFVGGLVRLLAWALAGPPHPFFKAMLAIELLLPLALWWMSARANREAGARTA